MIAKPIAFFSGHQCATVYGIRCEQLPPTSTWGTLFLGSTGLTATTTVTFYSVLAAHDETTVIVNCSVGHPNPATYTIDIGGNYHNFVIKYSSYHAFCVIEASKPVLVMEFQSAYLISDWNSFVTLLPATDQYNNHYSLPYLGFNYSNYVTINVLPQYFEEKKIYVDDSIVSTQWISVKCSNGTVCG